VYLGKKGWPAYSHGQNLVPFEPHPNLLAVAYEYASPDPKDIPGLVNGLQKKYPLKAYSFNPKNKLPYAAGNDSIWVFELTKYLTPKDRYQLASNIKKDLGQQVRVGMPLNLVPGRVKVMDEQFVVRFQPGQNLLAIKNLVAKADAEIVRGFIQAGNAFLIAFKSGNYENHLAKVADWKQKGLLIYGEPSLIVELVDFAFPQDPPNDTKFVDQDHLPLQKIPQVWLYLHDNINSSTTLGSPDIAVATIDNGIESKHTDFAGILTDGKPQVSHCFDFDKVAPCTSSAYKVTNSHGMAVFGIIAACANNNICIAGIAPNTHQIALKKPNVLSAGYPDVLLWAAGFNPTNHWAGWPSPPSPGADIISLSHGAPGEPLSGLMDDTFKFLVANGRGGKGAIVLYAAGNDNTLITGYLTWAAHPDTLAIANSNPVDMATGIEKRNSSSNYGPEIDLCARGDGILSLARKNKVQPFAGTSASTPSVGAGAALILSARPDLTWDQVRSALRNSADKIDALNADPIGQWHSGFSQWYGHGRLNLEMGVHALAAYPVKTGNAATKVAPILPLCELQYYPRHGTFPHCRPLIFSRPIFPILRRR
ncbi:MAG: S8 family serine peptidase, partial [Bdellovibrionales bacterium]